MNSKYSSFWMVACSQLALLYHMQNSKSSSNFKCLCLRCRCCLFLHVVFSVLTSPGFCLFEEIRLWFLSWKLNVRAQTDILIQILTKYLDRFVECFLEFILFCLLTMPSSIKSKLVDLDIFVTGLTDITAFANEINGAINTLKLQNIYTGGWIYIQLLPIYCAMCSMALNYSNWNGIIRVD